MPRIGHKKKTGKAAVPLKYNEAGGLDMRRQLQPITCELLNMPYGSTLDDVRAKFGKK